MSVGAEAADQIVRGGIQITESATKLAALGAKNLAALLIALAKDNQKLAGKTTLTRLLTEGKAPAVVNIKEQDAKKFAREAKRYGVLFSAIRDKTAPTSNVDIITRQEDIPKINRIFERMGYAVPKGEKGDTSKNAQTRAAQGTESKARGNGSNLATNIEKPSVKGKIAEIKAAQAVQGKAVPAPQKQRTPKTKSR
jgi:hypothetical protein